MEDWKLGAEVEVTATELKKNLGKYLEDAMARKETVITKNGGRIARLVPYIEDFTGYLLAKEEVAQYRNKTVSYEEFLSISEKSEARMEFINGEIIMQASPNSFHQEAVGNLHLVMKQFFRGKSCKVFLAPFDVTLYKKDIKTPDVVQPDVLVICDAKEKINEKGRYHGIPTLVVEVLSPSTRSCDMLDKLNTYMRSGCREYWVVDIERAQLLQYSFSDFEIEEYQIVKSGEQLISIAFPNLSFQVSQIFDEE